MIPKPLKTSHYRLIVGFKDYMEEVVQAMKDKDYDHLAVLINLETTNHGVSVTPKDFR